MSSSKQPSSKAALTLVGAGPGDPELLTIKAIKAIRSADVVLYDALVSEEILELIPKGIPAWSVGKRAGKHSYDQEEINSIIVRLAHEHGHVVRLKGGDPFVFGRGYEEMAFAAEQGLAVAVVPGISSALAVPAISNIPLTARGVAESFFVLTGTTKTGVVTEDLKVAARTNSTVVILMGLNNLGSIVSEFVSADKANIPVAIIENGTTDKSRTVFGTISTIEELVRSKEIKAPAIIVVGDVVSCASAIEQLTGRRNAANQ